jgi:ABC-type branched-subunit amino acid transport system substrate-binding protein
MRIRRTFAFSIAVVAAAGLAACSSNGNGSKSNVGASKGASSSAPTPTPTFAGDPIKIGLIADLGASNLGNAQPEIESAENAALNAINAAGGVNGHKLTLVACDAAGDANKAANCGRKMVSEKVAAVVGDQELFSDKYASILSTAGIPRVGDLPLNETDYTGAGSWPVEGGGAVMFFGDLIAAKQQGLDKVYAAVVDLPGVQGQTTLTQMGAAKLGLRLVDTSYVPSGTADLSPYVTKAIKSGADVVLMGLDPLLLHQWATTSKTLGAKYALASAAEAVDENTTKELGAAGGPLENSLLASAYPPVSATSNPGIAAFTKEMDAQQASGDANAAPDHRSAVINAWIAVHAFANLAKNISGDVTPASVNQTLQTAKDIDMLGLTKPWTPSAKNKIISNISNPYGYLLTIKNGQKVLAQNDPIDMLTPTIG